MVRDVDVKPSDYERFHLIVWGDPRCNTVLRKMASSLPVGWSDGQLDAGREAFDADHYVPLLIYPNPLNEEKYVVLNSGPTFREAHDRTNSLQNPKLGDWAIVDVRVRPDAERPGHVAAAGFFDENWQWPDQVSSDEAQPSGQPSSAD